MLKEHEEWLKIDNAKYIADQHLSKLDRGDGKIIGEKLIGGRMVRNKNRSINAKVFEDDDKTQLWS